MAHGNPRTARSGQYPPFEELERRTLFSVPSAATTDPLPPEIPGQYQFYTDQSLTTPGLLGSYINQNLQGDPTQSDWRATQMVAGSRVDPKLDFFSGWGTRSTVGITGGSDLVWQHFSVQWDGYVKLITPHLGLTLNSDNGSRMWIDVNHDGNFDSTASEYTSNVWGQVPNFIVQGSSPLLMPGVYKVRIQFAVDMLNAFKMTAAAQPMIRVAYVIPSNRTPQPGAVAALQQAIPWMQNFYQEQMDRYGFPNKTLAYETQADGVTPQIWVVHVNDTDANMRLDLYNNTLNDVAAIGVPTFASGQDWLLIPETHVESSNGAITGSTSLGASFGSGLDGGEALNASDGLPFLTNAALTDDRPYAGMTIPAIGKTPLVFGTSYPTFNGSTISSLSSVFHGALIHELTHGLGLPHDQINDDNFHGNLMYNGFRGFRGWSNPFRYSSDDMTLGYDEALALSSSDYLNPLRPVNSSASPGITSVPSGLISLAGGLLPIHFTTVDPLGLSSALLLKNGDLIGAMPISGTRFDGTITTPYFTKGQRDTYSIVIYDQNGNRSQMDVPITPNAGSNAAPQPFVQLSKSTVTLNQPILLDASRSTDPDDAITSVAWDLGDGIFTAPSTLRTMTVKFASPGTHLIRVRLTDAHGNQSISNPLAIRVLPAGTTLLGMTVNDGSIQRSMVNSLTLNFDQPVNLVPGALQLRRRDNGAVVPVSITNPSGDSRTFLISFTGPGIVNGSLADGIYDLSITAANVQSTSLFAQPMIGGNKTLSFHRLFGDANGDARVDSSDVSLFRTTYNKSAADPGFLPWFDFNGDGIVNAIDLAELRKRLGTRLVYTATSHLGLRVIPRATRISGPSTMALASPLPHVSAATNAHLENV